MNSDQAKELLFAEACRISKAAPGTTWFLFGSFLRHPQAASDIDVLVYCESHQTAQFVRREADDLCVLAPVHLLLLTAEEEAEIGFIKGQGCEQFYP